MPGDPTTSPSRRNPLLWIAPLLAIAGFLSYWGYFVRWPALRDTGALNLALLLLALGLSGLALRRAWSAGVWRRVAGVAGVLLCALLTAAFVGYVYLLSYQLPDTEGVVALGAPLPALTLPAHDGTQVDLADAAEGPLVLVFYRGHW